MKKKAAPEIRLMKQPWMQRDLALAAMAGTWISMLPFWQWGDLVSHILGAFICSIFALWPILARDKNLDRYAEEMRREMREERRRREYGA